MKTKNGLSTDRPIDYELDESFWTKSLDCVEQTAEKRQIDGGLLAFWGAGCALSGALVGFGVGLMWG